MAICSGTTRGTCPITIPFLRPPAANESGRRGSYGRGRKDCDESIRAHMKDGGPSPKYYLLKPRRNPILFFSVCLSLPCGCEFPRRKWVINSAPLLQATPAGPANFLRTDSKSWYGHKADEGGSHPVGVDSLLSAYRFHSVHRICY